MFGWLVFVLGKMARGKKRLGEGNIGFDCEEGYLTLVVGWEG